ncbi:squalene/phytoene synthase family protein [Pararhodospirillum photometricum]|uniref:Putative phytoene synthase protein n=1 Tax=Pararhodospirillum photometricum DSM 122 TaxID=1150469 RepID=H6SLW6_PARPM|nr:squalene/phytoene synthase family protein [Pararhodospirillum photometricum]CCG08981.1 Putative phytoene synthase protein [Pararhodospirillum photometricum DSM 122]
MPSLALPPLYRLVLEEDPDRFQTALYAPAGHRDALMTLYGLDATVARIAPAVSEPVLGLMRLRWWQEVVAGTTAAAGHPVAEALPALVGRLGHAALAGVLAAHAAALESPPTTPQALEASLEATSGQALALAVRVLNGAGQAEEAARHVGTAWGLLTVARAQERGGEDDLLRDRARHRLAAGRALGQGIPRRCLSPLLLAVLTEASLNRRARGVLDSGRRVHPGRLALALLGGRF